MNIVSMFIGLTFVNNVVLSKFYAICPLLGVSKQPKNALNASLVQFVEMFLKKTSPEIYKAMGVYLPLITTNCAVLGVALDNISANYSLLESAVAGIAVPLGFTIVIYVFALIRER